MIWTRRELLKNAAAGLLAAPVAGLAPAGIGTWSVSAATARPLIWHAPTNLAQIDWRFGPSGRAAIPRPPLRFVEEDMGGTNPKIKVRDKLDRLWIAKWGSEVHSEAFAPRIVTALGYFARNAFFVPNGRILDIRALDRAADHIDPAGNFENASFRFIDENLPYLNWEGWSWADNPFVDNPERLRRLNGLKIVVMLLSNWDTKDATSDSTNLAIYDDSQNGAHLYAFDDWGASMGKWGHFMNREKWDCEGYALQTLDFVKGIDSRGFVQWGYEGKNSDIITHEISCHDVEFIMGYLPQIGSEALRTSLASCGATPEETEVFAEAFGTRVSQLKAVLDGTLAA